MRSRVIVHLAALVALVVGSPLAAQSVRGRVVDDTSGAPVGGVAITLLDDAGRESERDVRSADDGTFRIHAPGQGAYRVVARRIGYSPLTTAEVRVGLGEVVTVELRLSPMAQVVAAVRVVARRRFELNELMSTDGFDLRRTRGVGNFLGPEDMERAIARYGKKATVGVLAENGQALMRVGMGTIDEIFRVGIGCAPHVYLDGIRRTAGGVYFGENAFSSVSPIRAAEVYGIEVYRKHEIPPMSLGGSYGTEPVMDTLGALIQGPVVNGNTMAPNTCGIIAVWTKARMRFGNGLPGPHEPALRGVLIGSASLTPIPDAGVALLTEAGAEVGPVATTDSVGCFAVRIPTTGRFRLRAMHNEHATVTTPPFAADTGMTQFVELMISKEGQVLAPLTLNRRLRGPLVPLPVAGDSAATLTADSLSTAAKPTADPPTSTCK